MWSSSSEKIGGSRGIKASVQRDSQTITFLDFLKSLEEDGDFRSFFLELLSASPFPAFRWETPAVSAATLGRSFEFVLLDSPGLASKPDTQAFSEHFDKCADAVEFSNLGGDAILIVPCPIAPISAYGHLAAFVREAPASQQHALWQMVGRAMRRRIGARPVWLNTAGAGVSWLHVRLDDRPKYYGYAPYRIG